MYKLCFPAVYIINSAKHNLTDDTVCHNNNGVFCKYLKFDVGFYQNNRD